MTLVQLLNFLSTQIQQTCAKAKLSQPERGKWPEQVSNPEEVLAVFFNVVLSLKNLETSNFLARTQLLLSICRKKALIHAVLHPDRQLLQGSNLLLNFYRLLSDQLHQFNWEDFSQKHAVLLAAFASLSSTTPPQKFEQMLQRLDSTLRSIPQARL